MSSEAQSISTHQLLVALVELPLYQPHELAGADPNDQVKRLRLHKGKFDAYCPKCGKSTTWSPIVSNELEARAKQEQASAALSSHGNSAGPIRHFWAGDFGLRISCGRVNVHVADFHFTTTGPSPRDRLEFSKGALAQLDPTCLVKIGQWPSLTDFQLGNLSNFDEGMSRQQRKEFVRGTNCAAHGFFVASCVYFRRVFESVLLEARAEYMSRHNLEQWPEFDRARTDERIALLREHLPKFMSEHPHLYSVLSLGVHELTEDQCQREVPMLRSAIELIMQDRVTEVRQRRQREQVSKLLAQAIDRHKT
ncbi:hypothetical protein [Methylibium rhizosphaerae]|uniref:hypothetical protein n=1 Tax=Methylibium rhizosphaerae TaxID=2570323 RepID=UPI00112E0D0E|nr:hypothetical protein [Methylibium rhizosphaerae]